MKPRDLIRTAWILADAGKRRPTGASLARAVSTAYYAMFHHITQECANLLIGTNTLSRSNEAWRQVYRALDHAQARSQCKNKVVMAKFPKAIEDFANFFVAMQEKRHAADYDPTARFTKSGVINDLRLVEKAIADFSAAPIVDRRAFCAFLLFKDRKS